jgi:hypothetical protein
MASDGNPVQIPAISLVHGSQAPITVNPSGKNLPSSGSAASAPSGSKSAASTPQASNNSVSSQVALLNKHLNDSGKPDQFRVNPVSDQQLIQEINPATGAVIAEYPVIAFPLLAKSLGISGAVIDEHA